MDCDLYRQDEFRQAAGAEFRPGGLALTEELALACDLQPGHRVLDVACGLGSTASYLTCRWGVQTWGLDAHADFLEEARRRDWEVDWVLGDAKAIPFLDGYFDAVFAECFLSAADDPVGILREIRRVLRPGGRLAMSDVYLRNPGARISFAPPATCLAGSCDKETTIRLITEAGLDLVLWEDRSDALKVFMAELIFAYGSASDFWRAAGAAERATGREEFLDQLFVARPGYFTLVAEAVDTPARTASCV
jgi:SAM-dependent methyltransferase